VQTLILRAVFLCRRADVDYFFQGNAADFTLDPLRMRAPAPIWISRQRGSISSRRSRPKTGAMWSEGWRRFLRCCRRMKPSASAS
jgi:hypothetical protein